MQRFLLRSFLVITGLVYLWALSGHAVDAWVLGNPFEENLQRAMRWSTEDPALWRVYARSKLVSLDAGTWRAAIPAYEQALARNSLDTFAWEGLATVHARLGDARKSEMILRRGMVAVPHSPSLAWRLANLLVQQERAQEALPYFRAAASGDPGLRPALFETGWKLLGDPQRIFRELVPQDREAKTEYLRFLVYTKRELAGAYPVWEEVRKHNTEEARKLGQSFTEELAAAGMGAEASRVWQDLAVESASAASRQDGNLTTNGSFESELLNAGLDWRLLPEKGFEMALDSSIAQHGARSLRVTFHGSSNPDFASVRQWIPVEAGQRYRFRGYLKTEEITTDNGPHFSLNTQGAPPGESWERGTQSRVGTTSWLEERVDFQTGPNTRVIQVQLRRARSSKLNNLLQGTVWIDNLSITPRAD